MHKFISVKSTIHQPHRDSESSNPDSNFNSGNLKYKQLEAQDGENVTDSENSDSSEKPESELQSEEKKEENSNHLSTLKKVEASLDTNEKNFQTTKGESLEQSFKAFLASPPKSLRSTNGFPIPELDNPQTSDIINLSNRVTFGSPSAAASASSPKTKNHDSSERSSLMKIEEEVDHSFGQVEHAEDAYSIRSSVMNILNNKPFSSLAKQYINDTDGLKKPKKKKRKKSPRKLPVIHKQMNNAV